MGILRGTSFEGIIMAQMARTLKEVKQMNIDALLTLNENRSLDERIFLNGGPGHFRQLNVYVH